MVLTETEINTFDYQNVFDTSFVPLKNKLKDQNLALLQDYISIPKSVSTSNWLSENNIESLNFSKNGQIFPKLCFENHQ